MTTTISTVWNSFLHRRHLLFLFTDPFFTVQVLSTSFGELGFLQLGQIIHPSFLFPLSFLTCPSSHLNSASFRFVSSSTGDSTTPRDGATGSEITTVSHTSHIYSRKGFIPNRSGNLQATSAYPLPIDILMLSLLIRW